MSSKFCKLYCLLMLIPVLHGCAAAALGGAAAGTSVAIDQRTTGTVIEDQSIELKANSALNKDKVLSDSVHINFTSYNTVVLVTGEAPTEAMSTQVIEIVRTVPKVSHVHNEIAVAAPSSLLSRSSDSVITSKVKTKLLANENVKGLNVKVVTERGIVYLMGLVPHKEGDVATEIARQTGGVQKVVKLFEYID